MERALGQMLVGGILENAAIRYGDRTAIICGDTGRRFSFRDVDKRANRLANAIESLGLRKGDVLAFLISNRAEIAETYFALARIGVIGIPLNYRLAASEIRELAASMGARGLIYEDRFADLAAPLADTLDLVIRLGGAGEREAHDYDALLAAASDQLPERDIRESDPYYFNLTSGTTGLPKSYVLTQYNNSTINPMFQAFELNQRDVVMTVFPAFGRVGFGWIVGAMMYGAPNVLLNFAAGRVLELMQQERVTIVNLVPTMAAMLLQERAVDAGPIASLRGIVFAGSSLPEPVRDGARARLCDALYEYYGMQETGALVVSTPEDRLAAPASQGKPLMFSDVRIVGDTGAVLPPGEHGDIIGRSPNAVTAYFNNPEKSAETFRGGWVHTGDIGFMDERGYLTISGRKKDMIVSGGQNVHAAEIEEVVLSHPQVSDVAVFGLPDPLWGEKVAALIVPAPGVVLDEAALLAYCRERLAGFKIPRQIFRQDAPLPRTPTGKIQKYLLVEQFTGR